MTHIWLNIFTYSNGFIIPYICKDWWHQAHDENAWEGLLLRQKMNKFQLKYTVNISVLIQLYVPGETIMVSYDIWDFMISSSLMKVIEEIFRFCKNRTDFLLQYTVNSTVLIKFYAPRGTFMVSYYIWEFMTTSRLMSQQESSCRLSKNYNHYIKHIMSMLERNFCLNNI